MKAGCFRICSPETGLRPGSKSSQHTGDQMIIPLSLLENSYRIVLERGVLATAGGE